MTNYNMIVITPGTPSIPPSVIILSIFIIGVIIALLVARCRVPSIQIASNGGSIHNLTHVGLYGSL